MEGQLERIEKEIHEAAERTFNIASPKQLREVLFDELKLPVQRRTDQTNEASTDQETLEKLARLDPEAYPQAKVAMAIVEHRQITKLKGTYVDALPGMVNPQDRPNPHVVQPDGGGDGPAEFVGPQFAEHPDQDDSKGSRSARPSCRAKAGSCSAPTIRRSNFVCWLISARTNRCVRRSPRIETSMRRSPPRSTRCRCHEVSSEQRRMAKTVNFGVIYGMSAFGLAEQLNISRSRGRRVHRHVFHSLSERAEAIRTICSQECRQNGYVKTILGRRRHFSGQRYQRTSELSEPKNDRPRRRSTWKSRAVAADLMKLALLKVHRRLATERRQAKMLLTVHDELVFESPPEECPEVARLVREEMVEALDLEVPLKVDVSVGENWLDTEEVAW